MDKLLELRNNKTFICIMIFVSYIFGLYAFYSKEDILFGSIFTSIILFLFLIFLFNKRISKIFSSFALILYLIFIIGFLNARIHSVNLDDFSNIDYHKNVEVTGKIEGLPKFTTSTMNYKFPFKVLKVKVKDIEYNVSNSTVLAVIKDEDNLLDNKLKYNDIYKLKGTITTPTHAKNPSQFDYNNFLLNKGILKTFYADDKGYEYISSPKFSDIKISNNKIKSFASYFTRKMHDIRDLAIKKHSNYIKSPNLEVLGGIVFGDEAVNSPDEIKGSFINSGLLHLLAASGLNVALILSMWFCFIYFLNISYRLKITSGIFIVLLYTFMTGFPPSIVRAAVMLTLILIGKLIYRETNGVSLIFAAGFLILLFKPNFIVDVGFQLSFLVTFGLIVCIPLVTKLLSDTEKEYISKIKNYPNRVKSILLSFSPISVLCIFLVPFVAQLWAAPLQAYYFNTFSMYSIFANIAVIPFIGIVSFLGFISTAICFIPFVSDFILPYLDFILNFIIQIILNISNFFSCLPNSLIKVPSPEIYQIIIFYAFVIFLFLSIRYLFRNKYLNRTLIFVFILLVLFSVKIPNKDTEVIFFSVGNGDSALIKTNNNKYILIDTGRYIYNGMSSAKTILLEYFYDENIKEIDTLIVTHYDSDHSGGVVDLLDNIKVKNLILPELECTSKNSCSIKEYIDKNKISYIKPLNGQKFKIDDVELTNFIPHTNNKKSRNDFSTVTLANIKGHNFLFMADAGVKPYYSISKEIPDVDILKSAHHGAKDTIEHQMMKKLTPVYSVLSTGRNPYGHPNKETVKILKAYSKVLSTNELGAIKFVIKDKMKVYHFDYKKKKFIEIN